MASAVWYLRAQEGQYSSTSARRVDWGTGSGGDTIKVSLHTAAYTPSQTGDDFVADLTNEVSGNGYAQQTLGTKSVNRDDTLKHIQLRAANTTFTATGAGWSHRYIVIWKDTGSTATSPLLGYVDVGGTTSVPAGNYVIDWDDTDGVLAIAVL